MDIRPFKESDTIAVIDLWRRCNLVVPWNDPARDIERKLSVGRELFLVGTLDDEIIASVMGGYDGHRGWVNYLAVSPSRRKQQLGREIMNELELRLGAQGCAKINLQVRETNDEVIAFYTALGYAQDPVVSFGKRLRPDQ